MFKISKVLVAGATLAFLVGCSSSDKEKVDGAIDDVLNKDTVKFSDLDQHVVTYENTADKATHKDVYCPNEMLGDKNGKDGTWTTAGSSLVVNYISAGVAYTYQTNDSKLVKNDTYKTPDGKEFKVTKISETVCL